MHIDFQHSSQLTPATLQSVLALCEAAYAEPLAQEFRNVGPGLHALGTVGDTLVTHAMLVNRTLIVDGHTSLHAAYVELVATHPAYQRRGCGSSIMRALVARMQGHDIAALSPAVPDFYQALGWEQWRGPLSVRDHAGEQPSDAEEQVMILRLPKTPASLDLDAPLSVEWRPGDAW